jgi:hypothetical protein
MMFHVLCLSALVYLVPKAKGFMPEWQFTLAIGCVAYSFFVSCHVRQLLDRISILPKGREHGIALVSDVRSVPVGDGPQPQVQEVQAADAGPEVVARGVDRDQGRNEATEAREAVGAGTGGGVR